MSALPGTGPSVPPKNDGPLRPASPGKPTGLGWTRKRSDEQRSDSKKRVGPFRSREIRTCSKGNRIKVPHRRKLGAALTESCRRMISTEHETIERASDKAHPKRSSGPLTRPTLSEANRSSETGRMAKLESRNRFLTPSATRLLSLVPSCASRTFTARPVRMRPSRC
jgi:hypothetical protein